MAGYSMALDRWGWSSPHQSSRVATLAGMGKERCREPSRGEWRAGSGWTSPPPITGSPLTPR